MSIFRVCRDLSLIVRELRRIRKILEDIRDLLTPQQPARLVLAIKVGDRPEEDDIMAFTMKNTERATIRVSRILDAKGQPAQVQEDSWVWSTSDDTLFALAPAADGRSAVITAVGPIGSARVSVTVDADLGEGVIPLTGFADGTVTASQAVTLELEVGAPEPQ